MELKNEFKEYRHTYNVYFDSFKEQEKEMISLEDKIYEIDKSDLEASMESSEKMKMVEDYMFIFYKIQLILGDLNKIGERLMYIYEASIRHNQNLELSEEDTKFINNLRENSKSTFVVASGELKSRVSEIEDVIRKSIADKTEQKYLTLENIRSAKKNA